MQFKLQKFEESSPFWWKMRKKSNIQVTKHALQKYSAYIQVKQPAQIFVIKWELSASSLNRLVMPLRSKRKLFMHRTPFTWIWIKLLFHLNKSMDVRICIIDVNIDFFMGNFSVAVSPHILWKNIWNFFSFLCK